MISELLVDFQNSNRWEDAGSAAHWKTLETSRLFEFGDKEAFLLLAARRERRVAGDATRMMDGIRVGGTRVQRRPRTNNGTTNSSESAKEFPWMLT